MLFTALTTLILLAPPTLPPDTNLPPEPAPAQAKASEGTRFTNLENAVITLSPDGNVKSFAWKTVQTPDGPRIRVTIGDITIDSTRVTLRQFREKKYWIYDMWVNKEGRIEIDGRIEPKPKQP